MAGIILKGVLGASGFILKKGAGFLTKNWKTAAVGSYVGLQFSPETRETAESGIDTVRGAFSKEGDPPSKTSLSITDNLNFAAKEGTKLALGGDPAKDDMSGLLGKLFTGDNPMGYSAIAGFLSWCMGSGTMGTLFTSVATYFLTPLVKGYFNSGAPAQQHPEPTAPAEQQQPRPTLAPVPPPLPEPGS